MRGVTLIELLITLTITVMLAQFTTVAWLGFQNYIERARGTAALNQMIGAVTLTRNTAATMRKTATLCPAQNDVCIRPNHWHQGAMIFLDENSNGRRDNGESITYQLKGIDRGARVYWRSFRNRSYLQFNSRGFTNWQNGNFLFCPSSGRVEHAKMVILNAQGRARTAQDADGDGIAEDAQGRPVRCP